MDPAKNRGESDSLKGIYDLPFHEQVNIARTLQPLEHNQNKSPFVEFLLRTVVTLRDFGPRFFETVARHKLSAISSPTLYRVFKNANLECDWLEQKLLNLLKESGYLIGKVKQGWYYNKRKKKKEAQWKMQVNGITYIHDKNNLHYKPQKDDLVFFNSTQGKQLTPKVIAVYFIPVALKKTG